MNILMVDFETSGLNPEVDRITEVGALVVNEKWEVQKSLSCLVYDPSAPSLLPEITALTGISDQLLLEQGKNINDVFCELHQLVDEHTAFVVAYNSEFDEGMFKATVKKHTFDALPGINWLRQTPWLCAMKDVEKNYNNKCWKLGHNCLDHGLAVDPSLLHRAIDDIELTRKMLVHIGETPRGMVSFKNEPWAYLRALIPAPWEDGGAGKTAAQKLGYTWEQAKGDTQKFEKAWVKKVKERFVEEETRRASFKVRRINTVS